MHDLVDDARPGDYLVCHGKIGLLVDIDSTFLIAS